MPILVVEHRKPQPPKPQTLFEAHPLPWAVGEENESRADIVDANHRRVTTLTGGRILNRAHPGELARKLVGVINAFSELSK